MHKSPSGLLVRKLNPNDALFYNARGFAKEQLEQYEEAREDRQKSAELTHQVKIPVE